jgi:hypothetical protein
MGICKEKGIGQFGFHVQEYLNEYFYDRNFNDKSILFNSLLKKKNKKQTKINLSIKYLAILSPFLSFFIDVNVLFYCMSQKSGLLPSAFTKIK